MKHVFVWRDKPRSAAARPSACINNFNIKTTIYSRRLAFVCLMLMWLTGGLAFAQQVRATLGGRVTDPQGNVISNANVDVISDDTNVVRQTRTNDQGNWQVQFLLPGQYHFNITASGFKTEKRAGLTLQAADNKQIDIQLELGSESQSVVVTGDTPLIDTTSATSGTVITEKELDELPSQSHVATLFATLSPGVVQQDQGSNVVRGWSNNGASQFEANGGRNNIYSNNYLLDGMPDTKSGGYISFIPPMDTIKEFRVQTNAYDASIGRQAGSTINMQSKSGSRAYHGILYEYNQNNFLNANLYQTNLVGGPVPPVHFNQFGGTFGGPVWIPKVYNGQEKTFFFVAYEQTRNVNPIPATLSVPTELERSGDFSQSYTTQLVNGQRTRYNTTVYDPMTVDANGNRQSFPGNVIPDTRLSPIAQNILHFIPLPNTASDGTSNTSNNYISAANRRDTFPVFLLRIDQNWNNNQHSFVTFNWSHLVEFAYDNFNTIASGNYQDRTAQRLGIDHVWTIGQNKNLDMWYSLNRFASPTHDNGSGYDPTQLGFPSSFVSQLQKPSFPYITGIAGNFGTAQANSYQTNTYHSWGATLTQLHGNHTFHYGGEYWIQQEADGNIGNQGEFDFDTHWTRDNAIVAGGPGDGSTTASFLLGLPSGGNVPTNASAFYSQHYMAFFFQDDWRITPKLTVNLGLRWDYERPVTERYDRLTDRFDPTVINPISPSAQTAYAQILATSQGNAGVQLLSQLLPASAFKVPGAQLFAGVDGTPRTPIDSDYHEWQPRGGFAYLLSNSTVIRGGFGRFVQADFVTGGQNGFSRTTDFVASQDNFFTPYDTLATPFHSGILAPTGSSLGPLTNLGQGVNWDDPHLNRPYSWEYSLHLQQQVAGWLFELGYSHNKTYGIAWGWNENLPSYSLWKQLLAPQFDSTGRPVDVLPWNTLVPNPFYLLPGVTGSISNSKTVALNQLLNPIPILGGITENKPSGKNQYDALLAKIEHRFGSGLTMIDSFTWSKLFEDTSFLGPQIAGPTIEHKLGGEDRPLHLSLTGLWNVPVGRGRHFGSDMPKLADYVIGGWVLTGNYTAQSGVPIVFGTDSFYSGHDASLPKGKRTLKQWFDTSQFVAFPSKNTDISNYPVWTGIQSLPGYSYVPAKGDTIKNGVYQDFATYVRNYPTRWADIRQPGINEVNFGVYKNFAFTTSTRLQLRLDAFNAFNHPRFGAPDTNPNDSNFGSITLSQVNQARTMELGGKLYF